MPRLCTNWRGFLAREISPHLLQDADASPVNTMMQPFCNPKLMMQMIPLATEERLRIVIDTILNGLQAEKEQAKAKSVLHIAS